MLAARAACHRRRLHQDGVDAVEVGVDHDAAAAAQVHILLPPVRDVVGRPPDAYTT